MSRLEWDKIGERYYETGVDRGVLYPYKTVDSVAGYQAGVAWNGLTAVNENPSGAESTALYADNIKYLNLISNEEFGATIEAYTYPDEFAECDGSAEMTTGVIIHQQKRIPFGFSYRTKIGNDIDGSDHGYKIHLVYNALAAPSSRSNSSINDSPDAVTLSWEVTTTPITVPGWKPTAHLEIDSTKVSAAAIQALEDVIYGNEVNAPRLPLPAEVASIISGGGSTPSITLSRHSIEIEDEATFPLTAATVPGDASVTWSSANSEVASVSSNGTVTGEAAGNTIITAAITVDGVTYNDTCTVVVTQANG